MGGFAFVFPGQGSQSVGMLDAWGDHPAVRQTLDEASASIDVDIRRLVAEGPAERLELTTNTQVVMLTAGVACYRAWLAEGGREPAVVAGHSLGEYSALVAAGALRLADAVPLVRFRAQAMQEAVPVGAGSMVAVLGPSAAQVIEACAEAAASSGEVVSVANFNDPKQTVVAGSRAGVERASEVLKAMGAKRILPLPVSAPFHCALMKPAADRLASRLSEVPVQTPRIPVVNDIDVAAETDPSRIRDALVRQAHGPVRWVEVVAALALRAPRGVFECGPGKVLSRMIQRIDPAVRTATLADPASLAELRGVLA